MTAVVDLAPLPKRPAFLTGIDRTIAKVELRRIAELELNEEITEEQANERLARYTDPDLTDEARNDAWELLKDAVQRLSCYEMPGGCPCHDHADADLETLVLDADRDAHHAIKTLIGPRP